jgi:hypothetical protein
MGVFSERFRLIWNLVASIVNLLSFVSGLVVIGYYCFYSTDDMPVWLAVVVISFLTNPVGELTTPQSTNSKEQEQSEQLECAYEGCSNFCCNVDKHGLCCDCQEDMKHTSK